MSTPHISTSQIAAPLDVGLRRLIEQAAVLLSGLGSVQVLSFARNALIAHALAPADFGVAATITLLLQLVETLTDVGADRLIVQDRNGDDAAFVATAHSLLIARGLFLGALMYAAAAPMAHFFAVPAAASAFALASLVPAIKGFLHLDCRRAQRRMHNRPQMIVEVLPQAFALLLTIPALAYAPNYGAVVWLSVVQAIVSVTASHLIAERPYRLAAERSALRRQFDFGWPILLSALPLIAVYQGDRFIIAHASGMESLAAYTSAFMITMVPGLIAARVGHALMLPLFASAVHTHARLDRPFTYMAEITTLCAALYLIVFIVAGEAIVPLVFGAHYGGLGAVTAWLAVMWAMRMVQAVAGMALMATGETKPFLFAGLWRASVLPAVAMAAYAGSSMATIAAIGAAGELVSLLYCVARLEKLERGLGGVLLSRAAFLVPVMLAGLLAAGLVSVPLPSAPSGSAALVTQMGIMTALSIVVGAVGLAVMPSLRGRVRHLLAERGARLAH